MANVINLHGFALPRREDGIIARLRAAVSDYRAYLAIRGELNGLSDRELSDIGISRFNVDDIAREAVYGR